MSIYSKPTIRIRLIPLGLQTIFPWISALQNNNHIIVLQKVSSNVKNREEECNVKLPWGHLHCQTMEGKYGLPFCSQLKSCTGKSFRSLFFLFFLPYLQDCRLFRSKNFWYHGNLRKLILPWVYYPGQWLSFYYLDLDS